MLAGAASSLIQMKRRTPHALDLSRCYSSLGSGFLHVPVQRGAGGGCDELPLSVRARLSFQDCRHSANQVGNFAEPVAGCLLCSSIGYGHKKDM